MNFRCAPFLLILLAATCPSDAAPAAKPVRIAFLGPATGEFAARTGEYREGVEAAVARWSRTWRSLDRPVELTVFDLADRRASVKSLEKRIRILKPHLLVAAPSGRDLDLATEVARRVRIPIVLATVWEPRFAVDPADPVFQFGGNAVDHALSAAGYTELPLKAACAAALHDGTAAAENLARAYARNLHQRAKPGGVFEIPAEDAKAAALLAKLDADGVDLAFVASEPAAAARLLLPKGARPDFLFADGLLTPELWRGAGERDRFLVGATPYLVDGEPDWLRITREEKGLPPSPNGVRGYAAAALAMKALTDAEGDPKGVIPALRRMGYEKMLGTPMFSEWGQARFFEYRLWEVKEGKPAEIKPTYLPSQNVGRLLRHLSPDRFQLDPEGMMVLVTWGTEAQSTIDDDLKKSIGLSSRGYEGNIDEMVKAGVLARALARLNRLFWRNADGTPIPGVSYRITFGTKLPKRVKRQQWWEMRVAGDDPVAGGRAMGTLALVYSTFIERTMYRGFRLDPVVNREDLDFFTGAYEWGTVLEKNLRNDDIRALIDGFSGAIAMTGAHEIGHLAGLSHDTKSDRSIMNVEEGGGLEPDWAEWVPDHVKLLETRLKRHEPDRRK